MLVSVNVCKFIILLVGLDWLRNDRDLKGTKGMERVPNISIENKINEEQMLGNHM